MTIDDGFNDISDYQMKVFDTDLKRKCFDLLINSNLPKDQALQVLSPRISFFLFPKLFSSPFSSQSCISNIVLSNNSLNSHTETLKELLSFHAQVLTLENCLFPMPNIFTHDVVIALRERSKLHTLILNNVTMSQKDLKSFRMIGSLLERVTCLRYVSVYPDDSILQIDEIFAQFARDHLSKNHNLSFVDFRGSDIDLVATSSRRNLPINFAGELRRWARRLKGLAFESDVSMHRILRILNRQCPLLKSLCLNPRCFQSVSEVFDNLRSVLDSPIHFEYENIEPLPKLRRLCLSGHFRVTDKILQNILTSCSGLIFLNTCGCAVNFEQYWMNLPSSLEELVIDEFFRSELIKNHKSILQQVFRKCPNLIVYTCKPYFEDQDLESLRGLALLNGANSFLNQIYENSYLIEEDDLIAFELRVKHLNHKFPCINLF